MYVFLSPFLPLLVTLYSFLVCVHSRFRLRSPATKKHDLNPQRRVSEGGPPATAGAAPPARPPRELPLPAPTASGAAPAAAAPSARPPPPLPPFTARAEHSAAGLTSAAVPVLTVAAAVMVVVVEEAALVGVGGGSGKEKYTGLTHPARVGRR